MTPDPDVEGLLRQLAPQVLGALVRRYGRFDACEDAIQEALLAASTQWPEQGVPENPRGWLITVASRRLTDEMRAESARRRREETAAGLIPTDEQLAPAADEDSLADQDDALKLLCLCCHPSLSQPSQVALTLEPLEASPRTRSHAHSWFPRRRWHSASAGRSRASRRLVHGSPCRPPTSGPIGSAWSCTCST